MPFWWKRRRRPWFGRWRRGQKRRYRKRFTRRRFRYAPKRRRRRRRRRRYKVRRKKKKIVIQQWQPDSIKKCKIKGFGCLVLGSQGTQYLCYTNEASNYVPPKSPGGGGFGCEFITLEYLYKQWKAHNCIWTASNNYKDLCRYTGCTITLFRHKYIDFVFFYTTMPPFDIQKLTYAEHQPQNILLKQHHRLILSQASNPKGKLKVRIRIKPPKTMQTKWYFQKQLAEIPLVQLSAATCDVQFVRLGCCNPSQVSTIYFLNPQFWLNSDWATTREYAYMYIKTGSPLTGTYKGKDGKDHDVTVGQWKKKGQEQYYESINYDTGWFQSKFLSSYKIKKAASQQEYAHLPIGVARYNPDQDTGQGNEVWLASIFKGHFDKPTVTDDYIIRGLPLWMAFYGYWSYLKYKTKDKGIFTNHMFIVKSPAIKPMQSAITTDYYPILDLEFIQGKWPYEEQVTQNQKHLWYPTAEHQTVTINNFVESGPYVPRLENQKSSTWELNYFYKFYFKWGGPQAGEPPVDDPKYQGDFPTPNTMQQTVQVSDPKKQAPETMFHDWDYRRGFITSSALKRMQENFQTDSSLESDDTETPPKKKRCTKELQLHQTHQEKIQKCLRSLCEEDICQEDQESLRQFIHKQQQQQQHLKRNLFLLLSELKNKQNFLQLQTGILE
nr:MAG: ORF1 [Torque teno midi virus]